MKPIYKPGDTKTFIKNVEKEDVAAFDSGEVHPVYATFALARDAEWTGRLFVLEMKDEDEEGIGTYISVVHHSPALVGEEVRFESEILNMEKNQIVTSFKAEVGDRLIADGVQGQKLVKKTKIEKIFKDLKGKI